MATSHLDNVTEVLQRLVGVQQLQTFEVEDVAADAIARISAKRGDISRLLKLWDGKESSWRDLVDRYDPKRHPAALAALRRVLEASLVVQWKSDGSPKTFLPFATELINRDRVSAVFRDLGRGVVDGLWGDPAFSSIREKILERTSSWGGRHPLAILLAPLCTSTPADPAAGDANLRVAIDGDPKLAEWVATCVRQDWQVWLKLADKVSVDEQFESMASLISLQLHVATLWRLGEAHGGQERVRPIFFAEVDGHGQDPSCTRAAHFSYGFWRERAGAALRTASAHVVDSLCNQNATYQASFASKNWDEPKIWCGVAVESRGKRIKATDHFHREMERRLAERALLGQAPAEGDIREMVIASVADAFGGPSSAVMKLKDFVRKTGLGAGIVGPEGRSRKRYLLSARGIELLAQMHALREEEEVGTSEEDKRSVGAFVDDIASRYGIIINAKRSIAEELLRESDGLRPLKAALPSEKAMRRNSELLDRRLDALRLVRRYSDASSVIQLSA